MTAASHLLLTVEEWAGLVQGAFQAAVLSFRALSSALLHATYLNFLHLVPLAPTTFPTSVMRIGGLPRFSNKHILRTPYLRNVLTSTLNTPETWHVHKLDNLLKYPKDSLSARNGLHPFLAHLPWRGEAVPGHTALSRPD